MPTFATVTGPRINPRNRHNHTHRPSEWDFVHGMLLDQAIERVSRLEGIRHKDARRRIRSGEEFPQIIF